MIEERDWSLEDWRVARGAKGTKGACTGTEEGDWKREWLRGHAEGGEGASSACAKTGKGDRSWWAVGRAGEGGVGPVCQLPRPREGNRSSGWRQENLKSTTLKRSNSGSKGRTTRTFVLFQKRTFKK